MTGIQPLLRSSVATIHGVKYHLVAFYFPDEPVPTPWDAYYNYTALGNFYLCPAKITVTINGVTGSFNSAEAAFQATKWWSHPSILQKFESAPTGKAAFAYKRQLMKGAKSGLNPSPDYGYAGKGQTGAMDMVLAAKYADPAFVGILRSTDDAYLLEHNEVVGRDDTWSDNFDGTGQNLLGIALMNLREKLGGKGAPAGNYAVKDFTGQVMVA